MKSINWGANFNTANARYFSKFSVEGKEYTTTLNNFKHSNIINPNNDISLGNTCASSVTFSIFKPTISLENKEITIYEGAKVGNEIKYLQLGVFIVDKQESDGEYTKYTAYDRMYKADMPYFSGLTFPNTDKAVLQEICSQMGISLATSIVTTHSISEKPNGYTCREMIGYMAMLQGSNAVMNSNGDLELRWFNETDYQIDGHLYYQQGVTFTTSKDFVIEKLTCNNTASGATEQREITSGSGATGLTLSNPFMTQANLDEIYNKIGKFTFRPLSVKFVGDFRLDVGDIVTVKDKEGNEYKVPIMQITHECDGGLISTATSIGQSDTSNSNASSGPTTKAMQRYYAELVTINQALINKLDVKTAKITYATIINLNAVKGDIEYLKVNNLTVEKANLLYASIKKMEAVEAQINSLNVDGLKADVANIKTLMFGSASGGSLTTEFSNSIVSLIGDAQIKSAMIESIVADKITSGKIYTNLVEILSENGNLNILDNTIQIKDNNKVVRVQIGKDTSNDYNMYVWDKSGNLMFDALGLTDKGIQREIIRNDMVSQDANISAKKLDIESLFNIINEDGSHTIKSTKILVDDKGQKLDVAFKQMTTNVESALSDIGTIKKSLNTVTDTISTQGTQITAIQGQISSKVWQQDITTAVSEVQIGGRNILQQSAFNKSQAYMADYWSISAPTGAAYYNAVKNNKKCWHLILSDFTTTAVSQVVTNKIEFQTEYTFSAEVYTVNIVKGTNYYCGLYIELQYTDGTGESLLEPLFPVNNKKWETVSATKRLYNNNKELRYFRAFIFFRNFTGDVYFRNLKLEKGNKATDWTPAPEDVDDSISTIDTKVTAVSNQYTTLNQSLTSLTATVNSNTTKINSKADGSTVTALQNNITSLQADLGGFKTTVSDTYATKTSLNTVDGKFANYSTTTQMNSAITQSASGVTTEVKAYTDTKLGSYATTASLSAYIAKTDTGTLKSCIEAIAEDINLTASGNINISGSKSVNISGDKFTLSSTYTDIAADGIITTKSTATGNDGKTYSMQAKIMGGRFEISNLTNGTRAYLEGHGLFTKGSDGVRNLTLLWDATDGSNNGLYIKGSAGDEVTVTRDKILLYYQPNYQKFTEIGKGYVRISDDGTTYYQDCALSVIGGIKTNALGIMNRDIGKWCGVALNRTPDNDVSFHWDGNYLRIYIDNTIIASYSWSDAAWV